MYTSTQIFTLEILDEQYVIITTMIAKIIYENLQVPYPLNTDENREILWNTIALQQYSS